jgi:GYF domain 2
MTDQWYIARDGQTFGPYTPEQVQELSRLQPFLPTDQMLRAGTQEWRPALLVDDLFSPAPAPEPEPEPEPAHASQSFAEEDSPGPARPRMRRNAEAEARTPVWFWLGPIGGAALLGVATVVVMFTGRSRPVVTVHREPQPRRSVQPQKLEPPPKPRVEVPPPPTDYSVPKVDYTKGLDGAKVVLIVDTPARRSHGYVNAKGKTIYHGKSEEFYPDSEQKKSEEWYAVGDRHGPAVA